MPQSLDSRRLNAITKSSIALLLASGGATRRQVIDSVVEQNGELLSRIGKELARRAVGSIVDKQFAEWSVVSDQGEQPMLPGIPQHIASNLPPLIVVASEGEETKHILLDRASVGQLRSYKRMLGEHRAAVGRSDDAVGFLVLRCVAADDDEKLLDALRREANSDKKGDAA